MFMTKKEIRQRLKDIKEEEDSLRFELARQMRKERTEYEKQHIIAGPFVSPAGKKWYQIKCPEKKDLGLSSHTVWRNYLSDLDGRVITRKRSYEGHRTSGDHWGVSGYYCFTIESAIKAADKSRLERWPNPRYL